MPSATPGRNEELVLLRSSFCCLRPLPKLQPFPTLGISGLTTGFSLLASPRNLFTTPCFSTTLRSRVSVLALSIASRVPSYFLAGVTLFDVNTGWLTTPCPGGTFTLLIRNHLQVPGKPPFPTCKSAQVEWSLMVERRWISSGRTACLSPCFVLSLPCG